MGEARDVAERFYERFGEDDLPGVTALRSSLDLPFADCFRVSDGRIVEHEVIWDQIGMLAQLGALPPG
jgi:hypothetical protein